MQPENFATSPSKNSTANTIFALASAPGRAGVAVFRVSGPQALLALRALGVEKSLTPRTATLVTLIAPKREGQAAHATIDSALAIYFPAPHSFTGEAVVELHTHGSRVVITMLIEALGALPGLRLAEPGEFSKRAFTNGKMGLAEAEGLADLIAAETRAQHAQAMRQLGGETSRRVEALRARVMAPLALLEAYIDFPEEEIPPRVLSEADTQIAALHAELEDILNDRGIGEKIREGLEVVITGPPNAGKSSLLNALARREVAIVSPEAGTTRDLIEVPLEIGGYAVTLVDTAGIHDASGPIEIEGIRRAQARAAHADFTVHVVEAPKISQVAALVRDPARALVVITKSDLGPLPPLPKDVLAVSTKTGEGMDRFIAELSSRIAAYTGAAPAPLITHARHRAALSEAAAALARFNSRAPLELACEELRFAASAIGKITGKIWADEVLGLVFSRFCIGK